MMSFKFLKAALKDYRVGAPTVSSSYTIKKVLKAIRPDYKYIVEYGAGDGAVTKEILRRLPPDGRLVVIELNPDFIEELNQITDERLKIIHGDIVLISKNLKKLDLPRIDMIISNVPFSFLKTKEKELVVCRASRVLSPKGLFLVYQYSPILMPLLKKYFSCVRLNFEPRNFPPYFFMAARK